MQKCFTRRNPRGRVTHASRYIPGQKSIRENDFSWGINAYCKDGKFITILHLFPAAVIVLR
jgi:hypothetical protein